MAVPAHCKSSMSAFLCSLLLSSICFTSAVKPSNQGGGFTLDLVHRDSQTLPSYDPSTTRFQRIRSAVDRSFSRKSSLLSSISSSLQENVDVPISAGGGEYLMKIKIGTPPVEILGIADTGSDLTWTQCQPCTNCYEQNLPLFDTSQSSSYRPISCQSGLCQAASGRASCDANNTCQYEVSYGDRSHTAGQLAAEALTLDEVTSFPKFALGCGFDNEGTFGKMGSGIVGLGGGPISIIKQLKSSIGGRFSYCLTSSDSNVSSKISFGSNAVVAGPNVVSTPLLRKSPVTFYYLTLEGVSVGDVRVDNSGAASDDGEGNIIIDSGTTLTFIPTEMYEGVEAALVKAITGLKRVSNSQFGLCYKLEGARGIQAPPITAHFKGGADLVLPEKSLFVEVEDGVACLTLVASTDLSIFGNLNQMNYEIGYDLVQEQLNFLQTDCSNLDSDL